MRNWINAIPQNNVYPLSVSVLMESCVQVFFLEEMNQLLVSLLCFSIKFFCFRLPDLLCCIEREKISLHAELLQHRTVGQELKEILRYSIIYSPILCTSLKNPRHCDNYNQGQTETIGKATINACSSYTILSQETPKVRKQI